MLLILTPLCFHVFQHYTFRILFDVDMLNVQQLYYIYVSMECCDMTQMVFFLCLTYHLFYWFVAGCE